MQFHGSAIIRERNELDVKYSTPFGEGLTDALSEAIIKYRNHIASVADIELIKHHFRNEALILRAKEFHSTAAVNEHLSMDVVLGLLQPPQTVITIDALQDTYTRQSRPYNNYGYLQLLAAGRAAEGEFRTYIEFDLTEIIQIIDLDQAIMSIDFKILESIFSFEKIDVYECYSKWNESFLMWVNEMNYSEEPLFSFYSGDTVDITDLIKRLIEEGRTKFNIMLTSTDFVTFQSKESGIPPQLIVTYADPDWVGYIGESTGYSNAIIRNESRRLFHGVFSILHKDLMPSIAVIREKGLKEAEGTIVNPLYSGLADILANSFALHSSAMIMNTSDLASSFDKNASEHYNDATILEKDIFSAFADIAPGQAYDWRTHSADIKATGSFFGSSAIILKEILFGNTAYIKPYNELRGTVDIISPFFHSYVTITKFKDIPSEVTIGSPDYSDNIAEAVVGYRSNLESNFVARRHADYENYGEAIVSSKGFSNLYALTDIRVDNKLTSLSTITNRDLYDFISEALVRREDQNELHSITDILTHNYFVGGAVILKHQSFDLSSTSYIMLPDSKEHMAEAYIHSINAFRNEVIINQLSHMLNEAILRRSDKIDLQALADILRVSDIQSLADLRRISQILGKVIIREEGIWLQYNQAYLNGWHPFDVAFYADILARGNFNRSYAIIRTDARLWTPPASPERLPRIWVREDFLPDA